MTEYHPHILEREGKAQFVILPYEEFLAMQEKLADAEDLLELRQAKLEDGDEPSVSQAEIEREFGVS